MLNTFIKGLVFGAGFSISLVIASILLTVYYTSSELSLSSETSFSTGNWHELSHEEKIRKANAIGIVKYRADDDGSFIGVLSELHKQSDSVTVSQEVGDEVEKSRYYPRTNHTNRDGAVIFYAGEPPRDQSTLYIYGSRVSGMGDIPVSLLIEKFKSAHNKAIRNDK